MKGVLAMIRIWEIAKQPRIRAYLNTLITNVRAELRYHGIEDVIPVFTSPFKEKFEGFILPVDILVVTSAKSNILVKDVLRTNPLLPETLELEEAYNVLKEFKVPGAPVVKSLEEPVFKGTLSYRDIVNALLSMNIVPRATKAGEIMRVDDVEEYLTTADERVNKVWSKLVYKGLPGLVVVRSESERIPIGTISVEDFINSGRWYFRREAEHMVAALAKVKRIMMRGTYVATADVPITHIAKVMVEQRIPILPVVDEEGEVIGVITIEDVARAFIEGIVPGRVLPPVPAVPPMPMPKPLTAEEQVTYTPSSQVLEEVMVARVQPSVEIGITAEDILKEEMPAITINDTIEHARKEMLRRKTNYLLVVDDKGNIVGYVSKGNMLKAIATKGPLWRRRVYDRLFIDYILSRNIPSVPKTARIEDVAWQMVANEAEVVKVVDYDGSLLGYITKDDVVNSLLNVETRGLVENIMTPRRIGVVHPHHSLHHVVTRMRMFYLDALAVYDGIIRGVISENRLPFIALEDAKTGVKSRRLIWIRRITKGAGKLGRYVKITPLLAMDLTVPVKAYVNVKNDIKYAIELMNKFDVNGIPVVDNEGKLLGIVCKNDILRDLARSSKVIAEIERKEKERRKVKA